MTEHQKLLLSMLKAVDRLCREQKITYLMLGGTMLGAVRHQGFIPWDDDADIGMPREDYERFLAVAGEKLPEPYLLRHYTKERQIPYAFAHVENKNTTYIEARRSGAGYRGGVYLEIFPLDAVPQTERAQKRRERQVAVQKRILYALIMERGAEGGNPVKRVGIGLLRRLFTIDGRVRRLDALLQKDRQEQPTAYGNLLGHWGRKENIPSPVLFPAKEYRFEDTFFYGAGQPEAYLTSLYGPDYRIPPSEEEREAGKHRAKLVDFSTPFR